MYCMPSVEPDAAPYALNEVIVVDYMYSAYVTKRNPCAYKDSFCHI